MAEPGEPLTERELEIVRLLGTGAGNKEIAAQLYLSPNTVKVHLRNIFTKLEAKSRTEVSMIAVRNGWIDASAGGAIAPPDIAPALSDAVQPDIAAIGAAAAMPDVEMPAGTVHASAAPEGAPPHRVTPDSAPSDAGPAAEPAGDSATAGEPEAVVPASSAQPGDSRPGEPAAASPVPARIFVPVAPNPQPLPKLALWRRIAMLAAVLAVAAGSLLSLPAGRSSATPGLDAADVIVDANPGAELLLPGEATRWYLRAALPGPRARSAAVAVGSRIYLIGGELNQAASGDVLVFDPRANTWSDLGAPKPTPVWNAVAVAVGPRIYMAGGTGANGAATSQLEAFDTAAKQWRALKPMPAPLTGHSMAALNNRLYVFGDRASNAGAVNSYEYDIASDTWRAIAPMPTPRSLAAAAAIKDRIYVVGGYDEGREYATCERYVPASDAWQACAPMLLPRGSPGLAQVGANLFAVGGGWSGFVGFNERYDPVNDRWTSFETPLVGDWRSLAVAALPGEFYALGGYSNGRRLPFNYVYEVFTNRTFLPAFQAGDQQP
jgi:DNA-binding CsgD family transcriptional regulator